MLMRLRKIGNFFLDFAGTEEYHFTSTKIDYGHKNFTSISCVESNLFLFLHPSDAENVVN